MLDLLLLVLEDPTPKPTDVKAGPLGFLVWVFMILAVVALGFSLSKQLRKAETNKRAGVFGDKPEADEPRIDEAPTDEAPTDEAPTNEAPTDEPPTRPQS